MGEPPRTQTNENVVRYGRRKPYLARKCGHAIARDGPENENSWSHLAPPSSARVVGDRADQAYRRSDAPEKRRTLIDAWRPTVWPAQVVPMMNVAAARR